MSAAEAVSVETTRRDSAVEVRAHALVDGSYGTVWSTLTNYGRLTEFIPGMKSSRVVEHRGDSVVVAQEGEVRFLFFTFPIKVTLISTARPPHALDVRLLKGNLRRLDGGYRLEQIAPGKILLRWIGLIEPESLPPLLGELVMRANIESQFTGMVREIERREREKEFNK
ncbi:MAG: SRPBCC family protein [Proteobacteria bacterium]|nr:SRPBCC family protein [Pseudomonadota bacterium]